MCKKHNVETHGSYCDGAADPCPHGCAYPASAVPGSMHGGLCPLFRSVGQAIELGRVTPKFVPYIEPEPVNPQDCPYKPHHHFVPSFIEPTTWACEACTLPGEVALYPEYDLKLQRENIISYGIYEVWAATDEEDRWDFVSELLDMLTLEQLKDFYSGFCD